MPDQVVWTSPDGHVIDFTDWGAGYYLSGEGTTGLRSPSYDVISNQYAGQDGVEVANIRAAVSQPTIGLFVEAADRQSFRTKARGLVHAMRPKAGPGTLTVTPEWGGARSLSCYCVDFDGNSHAPNIIGAGTWWRLVLKLYAPSPWWEGDPQTVDFGLGAPTTFFPIFPLELSSSTVQGQFEVDLSDTDAPTYPIWTISGPGSALLLENQTTSRSIQVNASLSAGQTMVIDTRPGRQSVRRGDGTNLMASVTSDPALWPLTESVNVVSAALTGATAASRISGTFSPRYAGI